MKLTILPHHKYNIAKEIIENLQDAQKKMKGKNNNFNYGYYAHTLLKNININLDYFLKEDLEIFQNPTDSQKLSIIRNILKELEYISKINNNIIFSVKKGKCYLWMIKIINTNNLFLNLEHQKSKILHEWLNFKILNTKQQSRKKEYEILMRNERSNLFNFVTEKEQNKTIKINENQKNETILINENYLDEIQNLLIEQSNNKQIEATIDDYQKIIIFEDPLINQIKKIFSNSIFEIRLTSH